jgi:hypothetical protein
MTIRDRQQEEFLHFPKPAVPVIPDRHEGANPESITLAQGLWIRG